jgi:membrane protein YqaA with SNARE-associated domain
MLRKLYDFVLRQAASRHATASLAVVSFTESSFFPVPPDVMLAPMVFARPERAYFYAAVCTAASVLGAIAGYAIGYFLTPVGELVLRLTGHADGLPRMMEWYDQYGVWVILAKGLTPIPFKLVTIASGVLHYAFVPFLLACVVTRGVRFFAVAGLIKKFGPQIQPVIEKRLALFTVILLAALIAGFVVLKFLH